ncbi:MAG: UUP1 family membrane protein, partial [Rhodospirillales bacterium]|nr:UUP1 family membrane protein [Rhodospirillales bacterium]
MKNTHVYILAAALAAIGVGVFLYKVLVVGLPMSLNEKTELWDVQTASSFTAKGRAVNLSFHLPQNA